MAFGRDCRSTPCTSSEAFLRSLEREEIMREVATRFLGTDYFSRDEGIRLGSIRTSAALGGFGDREAYSLGDSLRDEDIRRWGPTYMTQPPFHPRTAMLTYSIHHQHQRNGANRKQHRNPAHALRRDPPQAGARRSFPPGFRGPETGRGLLGYGWCVVSLYLS
jgi:hypothetical protein